MRYLAIDYGNKRTGLAICDRSETIVSPLGLAICDRSETIVSPLTVIQGQDDLCQKIAEIVQAEAVDAIILGLPLNMDDSQGPQAKLTQAFAAKLQPRVDCPIHFQDERLTSFAAEEKLAPAELTRKKAKKRLDAVAAAQILEAFLESQSCE